jgi:hypothetical protein
LFADVVVAECIESIVGAATTTTTLLLVATHNNLFRHRCTVATFQTAGHGLLKDFITGKFLLSASLPFCLMTLLLKYFAHVATAQSL